MRSSPTAGGPAGSAFNGPLHLYGRTSGDVTPEVPHPSGLSTPGPWFEDNLITNSAKIVFNIGIAACTQLTVPKAGSLLGMSVDLNAAPSAGSYGIRVVKNDTNVGGGLFVRTGLTVQTLTAFTTNMTSVIFARGDRLKVWGSTTAALSPTTLDASVQLWMT